MGGFYPEAAPAAQVRRRLSSLGAAPHRRVAERLTRPHANSARLRHVVALSSEIQRAVPVGEPGCAIALLRAQALAFEVQTVRGTPSALAAWTAARASMFRPRCWCLRYRAFRAMPQRLRRSMDRRAIATPSSRVKSGASRASRTAAA